MKNQKGIFPPQRDHARGVTTLIGIIIIVAVAVVAFGGVFGYQYLTQTNNQPQIQNQQQKTTNQQTNNNQPTDQTAGWKTYNSEKTYDYSKYGFAFTIKYPASWKQPWYDMGDNSSMGKSIDSSNYCAVDILFSLKGGNDDAEINNLFGKGYAKSNLTIDGISGIRLTRNPSGAGLTEAIYFPYNDRVFRIGRNRGGGDKIESECIENFNQMFSTFKFIK